jgi:hypothetical protein
VPACTPHLTRRTTTMECSCQRESRYSHPARGRRCVQEVIPGAASASRSTGDLAALQDIGQASNSTTLPLARVWPRPHMMMP